MLKKLFLIFSFAFFSLQLFSQNTRTALDSDYVYLIADYTNNFSFQKSYSFGFEIEGRLNNHWFLNIENYGGINQQNGFYLHTTLCTAWLAETLKHPNSHIEGSVAFLFFPLIHVGVTYYFNHPPKYKIGIYANPLCYNFQQLKNGREIDSYVLESGVKLITKSDGKSAYYFSVGCNYACSIGSKALLPENYSNGFQLNLRIGISPFKKMILRK